MTSVDHLPDDAESLKRLLIAARAAQATAEAEAARALAQVSSAEAMITHYKLAIEKPRRALYGQRSERGERLVGQLELQLEELEATATEDALAAETVDGTTARSFTRRKAGRKPFPAHLPRERIVVPGPTACACCGSDRLARIGEDITETLEVVPRQWKVIQTVREKFTCRASESIGQVPAPFHVVSPWLGRPQPAGDGPVREVRPASTNQSPEPALRPRGRRAQPVDAGRPGRCVHDGPKAAL
jgi:hypothetical protein